MLMIIIIVVVIVMVWQIQFFFSYCTFFYPYRGIVQWAPVFTRSNKLSTFIVYRNYNIMSAGLNNFAPDQSVQYTKYNDFYLSNQTHTPYILCTVIKLSVVEWHITIYTHHNTCIMYTRKTRKTYKILSKMTRSNCFLAIDTTWLSIEQF